MSTGAWLFAGILATGLIAAGCGGDDDDGGEGSALTKEEYVDHGNAICQRGNEEIEAAFAGLPANAPPLLTEAATTDLYVPAVQRQIKRLRELAPPEADERP